MKCYLCGKEVSQDDPTYPNFHYKCNEKLLRDLENLKVIKVLSIKGTEVMYQFDDSFHEKLDDALND